MDRYFPLEYRIFSNIVIKGDYSARAKCAYEILTKGNQSNEKFFCFALDKSTDWAGTINNQEDFIVQFDNNGATYLCGKLKFIKETFNFNRVVSSAIDYAEMKGGNLHDRRDRFREVFPGEVNIMLYNVGSGWVDSDTFYCEWRNGICYVAWQNFNQ